MAEFRIHFGCHDYKAVGSNVELREREKSNVMSWVLTSATEWVVVLFSGIQTFIRNDFFGRRNQ